MLAMGAELGHSQGGNNNAYAQDNATSWIDWSKADAALIAFIGRLTASAPRPSRAVARRLADRRAVDASGLPDVEWRDAKGRCRQPRSGRRPTATCSSPSSPRAPARRRSRRGRLQSRSPTACCCACRSRARAGAGAFFSTPRRRSAGAAPPLADRARLAAHSTLFLAEVASPTARAARARLRATIDSLAERRGHRRRLVGRHGQAHHRFARDQAGAAGGAGSARRHAGSGARSLGRLVEQTSARRLPFAHLSRINRPRLVPLRYAPGEPDRAIAATVLTEDGRTIEFGAEPGGAENTALADGRTIAERMIALPDLPIGRHRLIVDGVECALVIAPPEAYTPNAALRRRFGVAAQLYAVRRNGPTRELAISRRWARPGRSPANGARPLSASARCTRSFRPIANEPVRTTPPTDGFSRPIYYRRARRLRLAAGRDVRRRAGRRGRGDPRHERRDERRLSCGLGDQAPRARRALRRLRPRPRGGAGRSRVRRL